MAKRKFNAAKWLDAFDAIQHIYIYVARTEGMADQIGSGFRIWTGHSEDGTPAEMEEAARRYHELLDQMKAAPGGRDAVEAELLKRGRDPVQGRSGMTTPLLIRVIWLRFRLWVLRQRIRWRARGG